MTHEAAVDWDPVWEAWEVAERRQYEEFCEIEVRAAAEFVSISSAIAEWGKENAPEMAEEIEAEAKKAAAEAEAWHKAAASGNHGAAESHRKAAKQHAAAAFVMIGGIVVVGGVKTFKEIF